LSHGGIKLPFFNHQEAAIIKKVEVEVEVEAEIKTKDKSKKTKVKVP